MNINEFLASLNRDQRAEVLATLLNDLKWGPDNPIKPIEFAAICGAFTTTGCELMVLREREHRLMGEARYEVLLIQRPPEDKFYAGMYHAPGSVRRGHESNGSIIDRIIKNELSGAEFSRILQIGANTFQPRRGQEVTLLHVALLKGDYSGKGAWFPLDDLPPNEQILEHHQVMLAQVKEWLLNHDDRFPVT